MANGIDTQSLITQLMAAERLPQDNLKSKVAVLQKAQSLWTTIGTRLTALATASDALASFGSATTLIAATSSDANLGVRVSGTPVTGTTADVKVVSLATSQTTRADDSFTGSDASAGGRDLTLTINGSAQTFTSADGTIGGLVAAVNAAKPGVTASLVQVSPGSYQLVMRADNTGVANGFTAAGAGWTSFTDVRPAADAHLEIDGLPITRSSNVITDVIDGIELTLKAPTLSPSTVTVGRDDDSVVAKIKAIVDAANGVISTVKSATATSTDAATRGPLSGDYTASQIGDKIRDVIAAGITGSDGVLRSASSLGVSLNRDGSVTFDEAKLRASLTTDAGGVLASLSRGGFSSTTAVKVSAVTSGASPGARSIDVTQVATKAALAGLPFPVPANTLVTVNVTSAGTTHPISFNTGASNSETLSNMNTAMQQANVRIQATSSSPGVLDLTASQEGSAYDFSVDGALTGSSSAGLNAMATIDNVAVVGVGRSVTSGGVVFDVSALTVATATVTLTDGLAGALSHLATLAGASSGTIKIATDGLTANVTEMNKRIADWDTHLASLQTQYTRKFTAMDTMISQLNSQLSSLNSLLPQTTSS
jgi:flagellar hook-associated protein 2